MKLNKRFLAVLVLVVMAFSLAACSGGESTIVGTWKMDLEGMLAVSGISKADYEAMKSTIGEIEMTMEFTKDGKVITKITMMGQTETETATYKVEGNQLYVDGDPGEFKLNGNKLTLTYDGQSVDFTRK
ncbi:MAG: hypothetical protein E7324_04285 [Clostridiales bacterium]|nr:hypothetical protein [Clostridiales bacterium]